MDNDSDMGNMADTDDGAVTRTTSVMTDLIDHMAINRFSPDSSALTFRGRPHETSCGFEPND